MVARRSLDPPRLQSETTMVLVDISRILREELSTIAPKNRAWRQSKLEVHRWRDRHAVVEVDSAEYALRLMMREFAIEDLKMSGSFMGRPSPEAQQPHYNVHADSFQLFRLLILLPSTNGVLSCVLGMHHPHSSQAAKYGEQVNREI